MAFQEPSIHDVTRIEAKSRLIARSDNGRAFSYLDLTFHTEDGKTATCAVFADFLTADYLRRLADAINAVPVDQPEEAAA